MDRITHSRLLRYVLIGGSLLAAVVLFYAWRLSSLSLALAYVEGERLVVSPLDVDLGECDSKSNHVATFTLTNLAAGPIRIVGSRESCNCLRLGELPITIEPRQSRDISIRAFVAGKAEYSQAIILYVDDGGLRSVALRIHAKVL
jgi:hypothetical protein